jgi:L-threonylcarbamoyladenylate synthase
VRTGAAEAFERCIADGGVVLFGADTVYGLACDPRSTAAVARLYELKGRPADKPAAVMFFAMAPALAALSQLGSRTRAAVEALLPGGLTLLLRNPDRLFSLACGPDPTTLGLRVPVLPALAGVRVPVLQSSANLSGGSDPRALADVDARMRDGADLVLDGGTLPGTPSTVVDLRSYEADGAWSVLREGAVPADELARLLAAPQRPLQQQDCVP